jgi:hypothetical protein
MEIAGAIEVDPPLLGAEQETMSRAGWTASSDGRALQPRDGVSLAIAVQLLRQLARTHEGVRRYDGVVAVYDADSGGLVVITADDGRVSRRTVRRPPVRERSNVIDLATHRRWISRAIS